MNIKLTFHGMPHSQALENHAREKMDKITHLFKAESGDHPLFIELFLNAQTAHGAHHNVELHIKTEQLNLVTHAEDSDMYTATDMVIEKMAGLVRKEKKKLNDKKQKVVTEKTAFAR